MAQVSLMHQRMCCKASFYCAPKISSTSSTTTNTDTLTCGRCSQRRRRRRRRRGAWRSFNNDHQLKKMFLIRVDSASLCFALLCMHNDLKEKEREREGRGRERGRECAQEREERARALWFKCPTTKMVLK